MRRVTNSAPGSGAEGNSSIVAAAETNGAISSVKEEGLSESSRRGMGVRRKRGDRRKAATGKNPAGGNGRLSGIIMVVLLVFGIGSGVGEIFYLFHYLKLHRPNSMMESETDTTPRRQVVEVGTAHLNSVSAPMKLAAGGIVAANNHEIKSSDSDTKSQDQVDPRYDKQPVLDILEQAGIDTSKIDDETLSELPTWSRVQSLFGTEPIIHGLERCEHFRESTDPAIRFYGIAGTFNTGTNLLAELLIKNCQITERMKAAGVRSKGMRWQVPWGKHVPPRYRLEHVTKTDKDVPIDNSLAMVTIRDPYQWMQSMCRHRYEVFWPHTDQHCPNIVPNDFDRNTWPRLRNSPLVPIHIEYAHVQTHHESLPDHWNEYYQEYLGVDFPRIIVRFEDLLFYGQQVEEQLCACGGGVVREDRKFNHFVHISESAKLGTNAHGFDKTGLVKAIIKYGGMTAETDRTKGMTPEDLAEAKRRFDPKIMERFGYKHPPESQLQT